jgi:hypothetical protein
MAFDTQGMACRVRGDGPKGVGKAMDVDDILAYFDADLAAYDTLPISVRCAIQKSLVPPPSRLVAHWVRSVGARKAIEMLESSGRVIHNEAVSKGEVCPVRKGDSLSL